ncbi:hypothetical protein HW555_000390 [Spodoptera exigua]|uniref:glyceraldehyde-3-phosphate dehydrogenase (NADP(+)) (phosphorylating) n=1 Tax=Spodoptera exigua TaxID=7107 RepID=A0A835GWC8_SPOEX|nr:hypothetical protein HW555_000390 [Spodoptera exigua]
MVIKVGINGFGRIGRVIFRTCLQNSDIELAAINDPAIDIEYICYLIKFDSTHGKFKGNITHTENEVRINDQLVKVFREKLPSSVPWHTAGVQYVIEASGMFTSLEKASGHLACDGVKRVIVTAPSIDVPMIIIGVNDHKISTEQKVLSCASSTLYCLAPIVKVLEEKYGVTEGFITSIHAMTPSLKPLDGLCLRGKHWRDHRSIHQNIIPASTGACKALGKIIPQVKDKLTGLAFRVPIVNVSVLDLTVKLESDTNLEDIIKAVEEASQSYLQNIIKVSNEEAVSSDFSGDSHSCILDADSSLQLKPNFFKIICWYENEYSYACRVLDSIFFSEKQLLKPSKLPCKTTVIRAKVKKQDDVQETERNKIQCNVAVTGAHKISGSSSQETTVKRKPITRLAMLRKPLTLHNSEGVSTAANCNRGTKKRNELFKIWDDNNDAQKTAVRSNRSSLFHSCMAFAPKNTETENCLNAQERLENVKKEFCKMANITEDLLKKSYINKMQPGNTAKTTLKEAKTDGDVGKHPKIDDNKTFVPPISNEIFKVCGDFKKRVMKRHAVDCSKEEINCSSPGDRNKNISDYYMTGEVKKSVCNKSMRLAPSQDETATKKTSTNNLSQFINSPNTANDPIYNANKCLKDDKLFSFQNQIATNNMFEKYDDPNLASDNTAGLSDSISEVPDVDSITHKDAIEEKEVPVGATEDDDEHFEKDTCSTHSSTTIANKSDIADKENYTDFCKYLHNKNYNMLVIDEELKKRNIIILENSSRDKDIESEISLRVSSLNNRLVPEPVILIPDETSGYCSPGETLTSVSIGNRKRHKPDLYDKLDSASGTDSNNSFEINERKSQVIHITDLTNSLDDLARLDKICRIIEISDELSDKLFSSLEQSNLIEHKKWSFRDLCERIQLDDFCNKVFGKTSS